MSKSGAMSHFHAKDGKKSKSELLKIFNEITANGLRYCAVCLRTERERRLVSPRSLSVLASALKVEPEFNWSVEARACSVCEAGAGRALRAAEGARLAAHLHALFRRLAGDTYSKLQLEAHYDGAKGCEPWVHVAAQCEARLSVVRRRSSLDRTDTLFVDTGEAGATGAHNAPSAATADLVPLQPQYNLIPVYYTLPSAIVDSGQTIQLPQGTPQTIKTVILDDCDNEELVQGPNYIEIAPEQTTYEIDSTHPVPDDKLHYNVPAADPLSITNQYLAVNSASDVTKVSHVKRNSVAKKSTTKSSSSDMDVNSLLAKILSETEHSMRVRRMTDQSGTRKKIRVLSDAELKGRADVGDAMLAMENIEEARSAVRAPVTKDSKIDWEDKIPMDVISFMDATDPNADSILREVTAAKANATPTRPAWTASAPDTVVRTDKQTARTKLPSKRTGMGVVACIDLS